MIRKANMINLKIQSWEIEPMVNENREAIERMQ